MIRCHFYRNSPTEIILEKWGIFSGLFSLAIINIEFGETCR
jgi:hypothetical protein